MNLRPRSPSDCSQHESGGLHFASIWVGVMLHSTSLFGLAVSSMQVVSFYRWTVCMAHSIEKFGNASHLCTQLCKVISIVFHDGPLAMHAMLHYPVLFGLGSTSNTGRKRCMIRHKRVNRHGFYVCVEWFQEAYCGVDGNGS